MTNATKRAGWRMMIGASMLTIASMGTAPLAAQSAENWAKMRADMDAMNARMDALDADLAAARADADAANARAEAAEARLAAAQSAPAPAPAPAPTPAKPDTSIAWKGSPELKGPSGWSFKPRGRLQYDFGTVDAPSGLNTAGLGLGFGNEMRRGRLGVQGDMPGGFGYKVELDFTSGTAVFTDAMITYASKGGLTITAGQHNTFQGLEELTSSNDTSFIERAAFTDAFGFERRVGLSAQYAKGPVLVQAGVFSDDIAALSNDDDNSMSFDGRLVYAPKLGDAQLHLGVSGHWRDLGAGNSGGRYRQRPLVAFTDTRFIDTGVFSASKETSYGAEAAFISGRFHGAAEAHWLTVSRPGVADPKFFGGSVEVGYFLTPHKREYKEGYFRSIKVGDGPDKGGIGAVQIVARYDHLDLNDANAVITGGTQDAAMASIIWTPIEYVRVMMNYAHIQYGDAFYAIGTDRKYSVDVVGGRIQISF